MNQFSIISWLLIGLLIVCLFSCGGDDAGNDGDSIADLKSHVPTITIERLRSEKVEREENFSEQLIVDGSFVGHRTTHILKVGERISWRLKAFPAPKTDLVVSTIPKSKQNWIVIPKFQNHSEEFISTVFDDETIEIHPLPMVSIVGVGLVVDLEKLQKDLPNESRGGHRIPKDFDFPLYNVGDPSKILCDDCGENVIGFTDELHPDELHATTVTVIPVPGATIPSNQQFSLIFNKGVIAATVNGAAVTGSGTHWIAAPGLQQGPGQNLNITWTNRDGTVSSKVVGPYTVRDE